MTVIGLHALIDSLVAKPPSLDQDGHDMNETTVPALATTQPETDENDNDLPATSQVCPPDLALHAVELSVDSARLKKFHKYYAENKPLDDNIYNTWKKYKVLVDVANKPDASAQSSYTVFPMKNTSYPGRPTIIHFP